jgi:hypothetical protein
MKELLFILCCAVVLLVVSLCGCANQIGQQPSIGGVNSGGQAIVTQATGSGWMLLAGCALCGALVVGIVYVIVRGFKKVNFKAERRLAKQRSQLRQE